MNKVDVTKKSIGVNFNSQGNALIQLYAPQAEKVELISPDLNQALPLNKGKYGYWELLSDKLKSGSKYKFRLDEKNELPDPASVSQPEGVHGYSQVVNLSDQKWNDKQWKNIPLEEYIIYELHTGTFSSSGTFSGIEEKLDYLKSLGVNAIEIMPVASFPGNRNWGYDGVYPFSVQESYGGYKGLQKLVNACHEKNMAVILDVVYNHQGPEGNYIGAFAPYFTSKYSTPWGSAINFDDAWCDGVRRFYIENALMWFRDFHIDALRLDAVHAIKDFSPKHILQEIKEHVDLLMRETGKTHYLITELDLNDTKFINPLEKGGYGMDAQWVDEFHHALRVTAGEERSGYYSDFNGIQHLAKAYKDAYVYDGLYSPHRYKTFGVKADQNPGKQFIVFSQNHDQVGNRMMGERTSQLVSFEMQKLLAGAVLVSPFIPMLFMGEEYGESNPFQYFVSHTDPDLIEAVRKGRKAEFAAFHSKGEAPDPQSEDTFNRSKLQWNLLNEEPHATLLRFYQKLISIRKSTPALKDLNRNNTSVICDEHNQVIQIQRWTNNQKVIILQNYSKEKKLIAFQGSLEVMEKLLDSSSQEWKGPNTNSLKGKDQIELQPESIIIYSYNHA